MALLSSFPSAIRAWSTAWLAAGLAIFASLGGVVAAVAPSPTAVSREYQIKAVFLFNFLQFVEWPETVFASAEEPLCIGVLGDDPFGAALEETVRGETIRGRRLVIQRSPRAEELRDSHLLFVCRSEGRRLDAALAPFLARPVLTVSDLQGFAREGGVIAFYSEGKKVRFEINVGAARRGGLKISSELLNLGKTLGADTLAERP